MAENITIARPYAKAAFEHAEQHGTLSQWADMLSVLAAIALDDQVQAVMDNPKITGEQVVSLFVDVAAKQLAENGENFLRVLADAGRLSVLPDIAVLYHRLLAEHEQRVEVQVTAASALSAQQEKALAAALEKRLAKKITLSCEVDTTLLGGMIIRSGDLVIDSTVRGKLTRLSAALQA